MFFGRLLAVAYQIPEGLFRGMSRPAADELQHDLALMRPKTMLNQIDALPCPKSQRPLRHGDMQSDAREHRLHMLSLIHISEPTRLLSISYAVFCLKKKK